MRSSAHEPVRRAIQVAHHPRSWLSSVAILTSAALVLAIGPAATAAIEGEPSSFVTTELLESAAQAAGVQVLDTGDVIQTERGYVFDDVETVLDGQELSLGGDAIEDVVLPVSSEEADVEILDDGTLIISDDEVDLALQQDKSAVRMQTVIWGQSSPESYDYGLVVADGVEAVLSEDGGVDLMRTIDGGSGPFLVGRIEAPWAVDANGVTVPTQYELHNGALTQVVSHRGASITYPVVADPFWMPIIIVALKVAQVAMEAGPRTVKYVPVATSTVTNALRSFVTLQIRVGSHTFKLDKGAMQHILQRHHPKYWDGSVKSTQTFFNPNMTIADVRGLVHSALKQHANTLKSRGTGSTFTVTGKVDGVSYSMKIQGGKVVQFYPR